MVSAAVQDSMGLGEDLPLSIVVAMVAAAVIVGAFAIRVIQNTFNGDRPPIEEGIPFVGGLIKFSKVGGSRPGFTTSSIVDAATYDVM